MTSPQLAPTRELHGTEYGEGRTKLRTNPG
jgi:hypothetical protein